MGKNEVVIRGTITETNKTDKSNEKINVIQEQKNQFMSYDYLSYFIFYYAIRYTKKVKRNMKKVYDFFHAIKSVILTKGQQTETRFSTNLTPFRI